ncbi:CBS domain-containing protein [Ectothiorhodosinus mongolicus]|uniref:CBS domain-containing protein n=1 Tax=Ectothiorhodosinus mongolicus TaxID=233100 RepID=A0A1R3VNG2_9GAMM|nr:DUF294 nucleotidyltransferase-like domain-containing protein [Ectothiorhodosinus mongolicus]ULX56486.1 hypothetical protein CKX93_01430 [Ectothiorhodosinus mongolicus]SIT66093.1 CBS domain-containing protein [Ectothiorhodosinus mongolicus]
MAANAALQRIRQSRNRETLFTFASRLPGLQSEWWQSGLNAYELGVQFTRISDAITQRLIQLAIEDLGTPPIAFAWLACGSQGRCEQLAHTDQDNALILSQPPNSMQGDYFQTLAARVTEDLHTCGFTLCQGGIMASNAEWCQPVEVWRNYFNQWIAHPDKRALMLANNFCDLRTITGSTGLLQSVLKPSFASAQAHRRFITALAAEALRSRPPHRLPFWLTLRRGRRIDLKQSGLMPIIALARVLALECGCRHTHTRHRLQAVIGAGLLSRSNGTELIHAWDTLARLRLAHFDQQYQRLGRFSNQVRVAQLPRQDQKALQTAFASIRLMQQWLAHRFSAEIVQ